MNSFDYLAQKLKTAGILPSAQRIKLLDYLEKCQGHPTAEQIYCELRQKSLNLSKATVYNTLKLFSQKGLVRILSMQDNENRFDIFTHNHGHFICVNCGAIFDFEANADGAVDHACQALKNCRIDQKDIYFKGVCSKCSLK